MKDPLAETLPELNVFLDGAVLRHVDCGGKLIEEAHRDAGWMRWGSEPSARVNRVTGHCEECRERGRWTVKAG